MILKCIRCSTQPLSTSDEGWKCTNCGAVYPIIDGVARFVDSQEYTSSFGFQWTYFAQAQLDSANHTTRSRDTFVEKTGFALEELRGRRVLDAGCGMGRFAEICAKAGAEVHAVDLSAAVVAAKKNLDSSGNVECYQADILNLPFPPESFDYIYSLGVLHHTPDTRRAFDRLVPLLRKGGKIAIWVYSARLRSLVGSELIRPLTSRLPKPLLLKLCRVAIPLYYVHRLPGIGILTVRMLPTSVNPDPQWRWLDTFDWYSPRYQWKHTFKEVERWFRDAHLIDITRLPVPVSVSGARHV